MYRFTKNAEETFKTGSILKLVDNVVRPILSNRCSYCVKTVFPLPTIPSDASIGVDRVAVEIPLTPSKSDGIIVLSTIKNTLLGRWGTRAKAVHAASGADIHFSYNRARWSIVMEFNPSRFADPDGTTLVPVEAVARVTELLIEEYFKDTEGLPAFAVTDEDGENVIYWEEDWRSQVRIVRLDVARDFVITNPHFDIELYKETRAKYARSVAIHYNDGVAETWDSTNSKKSGHVKFYNKSRQAAKAGVKDFPADGTFRFEYMLRNKHLQRAHIHTLEDLTGEKFELALRQGWEIAGLGDPVMHPQGWIKQINDSGLTAKTKAEVIGFLQAEIHGFELGYRNYQQATLKKIARSTGLTFRRSLADQGSLRFQLDLETGAVITDNPFDVHTDSEESA